MSEQIPILDFGYVRFVEAWGKGDAGQPQTYRYGESFPDDTDYECGIVEAARQSTQGSFRGWEDHKCDNCNGVGQVRWSPDEGSSPWLDCEPCKGKGKIPGDKKLLKYLYDHKHSTPFEFSGMTIEVQAPIFVFREWHRHRTQSYNEMSARYEPLPNLNYVPTVERLLLNAGGTNKQAGTVKDSVQLIHRTAESFRNNLREVYSRCEDEYQGALRNGVPKELARVCLPVGRYSRMRASTNLRNWLGFLTLRMDPAAQWEIRQFANVVGSIIGDTFPRTWELFTRAWLKAEGQQG